MYRTVEDLKAALQQKQRRQDLDVAINEKNEAYYQAYLALKGLLEILGERPLEFQGDKKELEEAFKEAYKAVNHTKRIEDLTLLILFGQPYSMASLNLTSEEF